MAFTEGSKVIAAVDCEIFASPTSDYVIGKLTKHQSVVAAGSVVVVDDYKMLPIKPRGAVQVDYLEGMESLQLEGVETLEPDVESAQEPVTQGSLGEGLLDQAEPAGLPRTEEGSTGPAPAMQQSGTVDTTQPALTVVPTKLGREALEKAICAEKKVLEQRQRMHRVALAHGRASNDFAFRAAARTFGELESKSLFLQERLERDTSYLDEEIQTNYGKRTRRENYESMLHWAQCLLSERAAFSSEGPPEDKESALLWQRDYTRRAPHLDADGYAESARQMAGFLGDSDQRPRVAAWYRAYPHATTQLLPALLAPWVLLGVPASYAFMLLSALACWLALLGIRRVGLDGLGFSEPLAVGVAVAFACHPLVLRTFARPITDGLGMLLVIWTLWLLIRRMKGPGNWDEAWLALLVLAHPLARPQGFAYWPFIAAAFVVADRVRCGAWPGIGAIAVSALKIFLPAVFVLAIFYWQFDWWHNVDLMLAKARRFRIDSTLRDFVDSCLGVILLLPLLFFLRRSEFRRPWRLDPSIAL